MKWMKITLVLLLCLGLSGCGEKGQNEGPPPEEPPPAVQTDSPPASEGQPGPTGPAQDPGYVYLPADSLAEAHEDYVLRGYVSGEDGQTLGCLLDVSDMENVITLDAFRAVGGERVRVPLRVCGEVELCAVDLKITYDADRLEFVGYENADDDLIVNCKEKGKISVNFVRIVNLEDNFTFCDLLFDVITTLECESILTVEIVEAVCLDGADSIVFPDSTAADGIACLNGKVG